MGDLLAREIRFGKFLREITIRQRYVSYNLLTPKPKVYAGGQPVPHRPEKLRLRAIDVQRLLAPYVSVRVYGQVRTVVPLGLCLLLFQILILRQNVADIWIVLAGFGAVIVGLMLFMEGLKLGLMPFAEIIGNNLPKKSALPVVLVVVFLLGIGVTLAEPAIGALQAVGSIVDAEKAPYLWELLNRRSGTLVLVVGIGVGFAAVLGTVRFLRGFAVPDLLGDAAAGLHLVHGQPRRDRRCGPSRCTHPIRRLVLAHAHAEIVNGFRSTASARSCRWWCSCSWSFASCCASAFPAPASSLTA